MYNIYRDIGIVWNCVRTVYDDDETKQKRKTTKITLTKNKSKQFTPAEKKKQKRRNKYYLYIFFCIKIRQKFPKKYSTRHNSQQADDTGQLTFK